MAAKFEVINDNPTRTGGSYIGRGKCGSGFGTLWADAIDTGLAISLFDPSRQFGAMAHIAGDYSNRSSSPESIVNDLLSELGMSDLEEGDCPGLEAAIVGASDVSTAVRDYLLRLNIPVVGEDLGAVPIGREVHLHCNDRTVRVYRYTPSYNQ